MSRHRVEEPHRPRAPATGALRARRTQGAALITSLVMLLVMSALALTAMQMATLDERMAANAEQVERAFWAAESILDAAADSPNDEALLKAFVEGKHDVKSILRGPVSASEATVRHRVLAHDPPCPGTSTGVGVSQVFENVYFDIEARGELAAGGTTAHRTVRAGVALCAPAGP
jgi:type IV pilus assembly protein PilX